MRGERVLGECQYKQIYPWVWAYRVSSSWTRKVPEEGFETLPSVIKDLDQSLWRWSLSMVTCTSSVLHSSYYNLAFLSKTCLNFMQIYLIKGFPRCLSGEENACQCRRQETRVQSLVFHPRGWKDPLEKEMANHASTLARIIPWIEEPGGLQSMGSQKVRHNSATKTQLSTHACTQVDFSWNTISPNE